MEPATKQDLAAMEGRLATRLEKKMGDLFTTQTGYLETKMGKLGGEIVEAVDHIMEKRFVAMGTRVDATGTKVDDLQKSFHVLHQSFMDHDAKVNEEVRRETAKHVTAQHA